MIAQAAGANGNPRSSASARMEAVYWICEDTKKLLDIGCNVGEFLRYSAELFPNLELAGIETNLAALEKARMAVPNADLRHSSAERLPFADATFDCVTMIEVLEHVPPELRSQALAEVRRVLCTGGTAIVRVPHAGLFAWLDPNNFRFRAPGLYRALISRGRRDAGYGPDGVVWHHHFSTRELLDLAGDGWKIEHCFQGGLFLMPLMDIARWPFYRKGWTQNSIYRLLQRLSEIDLAYNYGNLSYDVLVVLKRN